MTLTLDTDRLRIVAVTAARARIERDGDELARALGVELGPGWPPPVMKDALGAWAHELAREEALTGWTGWYFLLRRAPLPLPLLIGYGGFKGAPDDHGIVEIGYALVDAHQGQGLASEAIRALIGWAWRDPRVRRIDAETLPALAPSIALLQRLGFRRLPRTDPQRLRFTLER